MDPFVPFRHAEVAIVLFPIISVLRVRCLVWARMQTVREAICLSDLWIYLREAGAAFLSEAPRVEEFKLTPSDTRVHSQNFRVPYLKGSLWTSNKCVEKMLQWEPQWDFFDSLSIPVWSSFWTLCSIIPSIPSGLLSYTPFIFTESEFANLQTGIFSSCDATSSKSCFGRFLWAEPD